MASTMTPFNLKAWIDEHRDLLKPPVGAEMVWKDSEFIIMVIGGPNARRDFHIDPGEEFFYQLEGDIALEYIDGDGQRQKAEIHQGDVFLLPANVPHSPQRGENTVGLVVERVRAEDEPEKFAWFCEQCDAKIYELNRGKDELLVDLRKANERYNVDTEMRSCEACGYVQPVATGPRL